MRRRQLTTLVSSHFPYISVKVTFRNREEIGELFFQETACVKDSKSDYFFALFAN